MSDLVCVGNYPNRPEAELAKAILEEHGIRAMIHADDAGGMHLELQFTGGGVRLFVTEENAEAARAALVAEE